MTLTPAGRYVVACLILTALLVIIGVAGRVATGMWDVGTVATVSIGVPLAFFVGAMAGWKE